MARASGTRVDIVLGEGADAVAIAAKRQDKAIYASAIFVGEGKRERVMSVTGSDREELATLLELLAGLPGVTIDCRPHVLVEMVDDDE